MSRTVSSTSLDRKLEAIRQGNYAPGDFIIADAKDADMAFGVQAPGPDRSGVREFATRQQYLQDMTALVEQGVLDVLLTSASNGEALVRQGALDGSPITLAVRANDTTDVWHPRGAAYAVHPSAPFATANLEQVSQFCDLVLYSITLNNELDHDLETLNRYRAFREQAASLGVRHFLEVFNPNAPRSLDHSEVGAFVNDSIIRVLAGVTSAHRPLFLKMAYNGAAAMRELVEHDSELVVGVLGGSAGTTRDTFELLAQAERNGARVSLFGRKIQRAESQLDLVALMPRVTSGELNSEEAVREYHKALASAGISPVRSLDEDLKITEAVLR